MNKVLSPLFVYHNNLPEIPRTAASYVNWPNQKFRDNRSNIRLFTLDVTEDNIIKHETIFITKDNKFLIWFVIKRTVTKYSK